MMLRTFLPKPEQRFAAAGAALGALFPAIWLTTETLFIDRSFAHWNFSGALAAGVMPFFVGASFYRWSYSRRLERELRAARRAERRLRNEVHRDRLTGLENRSALEVDVLRALRSDGTPFERRPLLLIDLDRFKAVNDTMGHDAGDRLLSGIGTRLRRAFVGEATVYRLGGDEFVLVAPGSPSDAEVAALANRVKALFDMPFDLADGQAVSGCSIGVTFLEPGDLSTGAVLKRADLALYEAKEMRGNSHVFYAPHIAQAAESRAEAERDLARAVAQREFFLEYMPIAGAASGAIRGFEALLRWLHPVRGVIGTEAFAEPLEQGALALSVGNWALRQACRQAASWPSPVGLTVAPFALQLRDRDFIGHIKTCLGEAGLAPGRLTIEVPEAYSAGDMALIGENLHGLRALGVRIALSGGAAASLPLNLVGELQPDQLTVDLPAIRTAHGSERSVALLACLVKTGQVLRLPMAVRGVARESEMDCARTAGAVEAWGAWISPALPARDLAALLRDAGGEDTRRLA